MEGLQIGCILNAIDILEEEIQSLRTHRDDSTNDKSKERFNEQILSHILSIQHLREVASGTKED